MSSEDSRRPIAPSSRALIGSVDDLLTPKSLSQLIGRPVKQVIHLPFTSVDGRSGGQLEAIEAVGAGRYVLKRISFQGDVTMHLTDDRFGRCAGIWRKGLLARLPHQITHGVVACSRDGDGWALLLEDFRGQMLPPHEQRITEAGNDIVLSAMAAMHETFWDEPASAVDTYGLCTFRARCESLFPQSLRSADSGVPIVSYALKGWDLFPDLVERDVADLVERLHTDVSPLCTAIERYPRTLLHGDCHHGNLGIVPGSSPRVILLDWTFVSLGPSAADLAEYVLIGVMRLPASKEATIERYRRFLAERLGNRFDDSWWVPQLELALLGEFLRLGWNKAQVAVHGESEAIRERERAEIAWWCDRARRAAEWL
jgi:Phosphotransferase enzyme family